MTKYVYFFGAGKAEGSSLMRNLLGGKGCELAEMTNLGIPVPPGFTITTQAWSRYNKAGRQWPEGLWEQVLEHLAKLEATAGMTFGDAQRPLLVSVRAPERTETSSGSSRCSGASCSASSARPSTPSSTR